MIVRLSIVLLLLFSLLGCSLQGRTALPNATTATADASPTVAAVVPTTPATAPPVDPTAPTTWTIGLQEKPTNVLPFSPDGRAAAPIVQAMFPAPLLAVNYTYTTTGVLETLPTLENGDVQIASVAGFLDATDQFTVTETSQPTTTQQLSVTYRWARNLRWADGTPLTAADSVFAYELYGQVPTPQDATAARANIERYEQLDEYTTRAVLRPGQIDPRYVLTAWPPLPRHLLQSLAPEAALAQFKEQPVGYGPFTFAEQQPGDELVLVRNEYWSDQATLPDQLVFRFLGDAQTLRSAVIDGSIDVAVFEQLPQAVYPYLDQDQQSGAAEVAYLAGPVYEHIDLNLADPHLEDIRVRQALAYALDRQRMIDTLLGAKVKPLSSWILPEQQTFYAGDEQLTRYGYDPSKARSLLDEAGLNDANNDGVRELADGQPFTLTLTTSKTELREAVAQRIAADLQAVGVQVTIDPQPIDQLYSPTGPLYRRTFQLALFAWMASADPGGLPLWSCNAVPLEENGYTGNNFSGWCFESAEWPLRTANETLDTRTRAQNYLKHQQLWTQELPVIPLFQRPIAVVHQPRLEGIAPDPLAPITWNISQWQRK